MQAHVDNNMFGSWGSFTLSGNFGQKTPMLPMWRWSAAKQAIWRDDSPQGLRVAENYLFAQLGYSLDQYSSVWLGYLHDWQHPFGRATFQENRSYQDYLWVHPLMDGRLIVRTRLDERVNQNNGNVGVRVREMIQINYPIRTIENLGWHIGGEVFAYLNQNTFGVTGFSEARTSAGLTYDLNDHIGFDLVLSQS